MKDKLVFSLSSMLYECLCAKWVLGFFLKQTAKVCDDNILLGLFLKHSQWPPKAFAPLGLES
jgi:hypothetical protein